MWKVKIFSFLFVPQGLFFSFLYDIIDSDTLISELDIMSSPQNTTTFFSKIGNLLGPKPQKDDTMTQIAPSTSPSAMTGGIASPSQSQSINIDTIFATALTRGASDIHIEPGEGSLKIRMRVDGSFVEYATLGDGEKSSLIARIKILSSLKIDEQRLPQDGKASYHDPVS